MHHDLLLILGLLFVVMLLVMLAKKLNVAYPIFLVLSGLGVSLIPGIPDIQLDPEIIFLIFLPPLLFEAAWYTSWKDFWKWRRPIGLLAFGLVFFTSVAVAYFTNSLIPGFTLALGFLLGGIISPPDAIAAATVLKGLPVPKRILTILEGESLVNDASSLIVFRFALAAVMTGTFSFEVAVGQFFLVAGMGVVVGLAIAHVMYAIHKFLPTTPAIDATLTVMTPYILFLTAEHFHFSGVMAVVSGGLFISFRSHEIFTTGTTRINMLGVWTTLIFAMNTVVFILIGLELPNIVGGLGEYSIEEAIRYGLLISVIIIVLRFVWVFPAAYLPRYLSKKVRQEVHPGWKGPVVISWAGMRGVVSLATALSIPVTLSNGDAFPYRNLILFITFIVILVTLVFQGLTLPLIVRWIKLREIDPVLPEAEQQTGIRLRLKRAALHRLQRHYAGELAQNELVGLLEKSLKSDVEVASRKLIAVERDEKQLKELEQYRHILEDLYAAQRQELSDLRREHFFSDEEIRKAQLRLDLDEAKLVRKVHF